MSDSKPAMKMVIARSRFDALPDYSCSLPTGTRYGKRWKRRNSYYDESQGWVIGEYFQVDTEPAAEIGIRWYEPLIVEGA